MNSLRLTVACYKRGLLSKEAMVDVLRTRDQLVKEAIRKQAATIFSSAGRGVSSAGRGIVNKLKQGNLTGGGRGQGGGSSWGDVVSNVGKLTALAGLTAGAGTGIHHVIRHSKDKKLNEQVQSSYNEMFNEHPDLARLREADPQKVQRNFGLLAQYAPSLAANPVVAGSFVATMHSTRTITPEMVRQLADTQMVIDKRTEMHSPVKGKWQEGMGLARSAIGA